MTDRERHIDRHADFMHEHCDAVLVVATWVDDNGVTQTRKVCKGNAHTVEGMVYWLTVQQDDAAETEEPE